MKLRILLEQVTSLTVVFSSRRPIVTPLLLRKYGGDVQFHTKLIERIKEITRTRWWRTIEAMAIGGAFIAVGINHFLNPDFFEAIVPRWFWSPSFANEVSGAAEIILGAALIPIWSRRYAAYGLLILLVLVYPANIDMFINDVDVQTNASGVAERVVNADGVRLRNFIRLPFQFLFGWLVWRHAKHQPRSSPNF